MLLLTSDFPLLAELSTQLSEWSKWPVPDMETQTLQPVSSTNEYPPPTWLIKEWAIDAKVIEEELSEAFASGSANSDPRLESFRKTGIQFDHVMSESGVQSALDAVFREIALALSLMRGNSNCFWGQEPPVGFGKLSNQTFEPQTSISTAIDDIDLPPLDPQQQKILKVQGFLGLKPDFELFSGTQIVSFCEAKFPDVLDSAGLESLATFDLGKKRDSVLGQVESYVKASPILFAGPGLSSLKSVTICSKYGHVTLSSQHTRSPGYALQGTDACTCLEG